VNINVFNQSVNNTVQNIQLFNLNGALLIDRINPASSVDVSHLPKGIYLVRVRLADKLLSQKLIIN